MTANLTRSLTIRAPAKLNLGLEILGVRDDGFHEIRTLMAMLEFGDDLLVSTAPELTVEGIPGVGHDANLISRAVVAFRVLTGADVHVDISVTKRLPIAAGLGGASTDAAAALLALNAIADVPMSNGDLHLLAAELGSDVPFFLGSPLALSSGTGTDLSPLVPVPFDVILIVPYLRIANKTATLYKLLEPVDCSDGVRIQEGIRALAMRQVPDRFMLKNAFECPLYSLAPEMLELRKVLDSVDCIAVGLSGAGPTHYVIPHAGCALRTERELRNVVSPDTCVIPTRSRLTELQVEFPSLTGMD